MAVADLIAIEAGLLLGAAYKYAGSLWLPIGIHWAWNFTQGNVLGFAVSGYDKEESIFDAVRKKVKSRNCLVL